MRPVDTSAPSPYTGRETLLKNRAARSGSFGVHGRTAVMLGALFLVGAATPVALNADTILAQRLADWNGAWWLRAHAVTCVAVLGLAMLVHGMRGLRRASVVAHRRAASAHQPWRWDYEWDERGARDDDSMRRARQFIVAGIGTFGIGAPIHWITLEEIGRRAAQIDVAQIIIVWLPLGLGILLLDLIAMLMLAKGGKLILRRLKYGPGMATFARFPFRVGEPLELHVQAPRSLPQHAVVTATLRCIQERYVTTETRRGETQTNIQCFELYRDSTPADHVATGAGTRTLRVRFDLPRDGPVTDLTSRPCRYWEIDVEASTDGLDYAARFLVPVY